MSLTITFKCPAMPLHTTSDPNVRMTAQEPMAFEIRDVSGSLVHDGTALIPETAVRKVSIPNSRVRWRVDTCTGLGDGVQTDLPFEDVWFQFYFPWLMPTMVAKQIVAPTRWTDPQGRVWSGKTTFPDAPLMWWKNPITVAAVVATGTLD